MKVALLKPEPGRGFLPYALLYLAASVRRAGSEPLIFHSGAWADDADAALASGAELVAVSALTGPNLLPALATLTWLKSGKAPTVLGGVHATLMPELALTAGADYVVNGEGEIPLARLAAGEPPDGIPGLGFLRAGAAVLNPRAPMVHLDDYPLPWELVDLSRYLYRGADGLRTLPLLTSRGCPFRCGFCYAQAMHQLKWRAHSVAYLADAKREIEQRARPEAVQFFDDNFFVDRARAEAVVALWDRPWQAEVRADLVDAAFAGWAKRSRCQRLFLGAESGSDRILELLGKKLTTAQLEAAVATLAAAGIPADLSFVIGFPDETAAEREQTFAFIDRLLALHPRATATVKVFTPYPGTPLWNPSLRAGFRAPETNADWALAGRHWVDLPWLDAGAAAQAALASRYALCRAADLRPAGYPLYRPLAAWRWRGRRFGFPLEARLYRWLKQ